MKKAAFPIEMLKSWYDQVDEATCGHAARDDSNHGPVRCQVGPRRMSIRR